MGSGGPDGEVWSTYSDIAGYKFGTLLFKSVYENWEPTLKVKAYHHNFPADKYSLEKHIDYTNLEEHRKYKRFHRDL